MFCGMQPLWRLINGVIVSASTINVVLSWSDMQCLKFWFSSLFWYSLIHSYR